MVIFNELGVAIKEIDARTIGNKNVDFLAIYNNEKIYVEVKGFVPEDYYIAKKGGAMDADDGKIRKALIRATPKFFGTTCNILVIADENTIKTPLMSQVINSPRIPETYLNVYDTVSAIIILEGPYEERLLEFGIWYNANPRKLLHQDITEIFNRRKSNQ